jgi:hypothetical protein
MLMKVKCLNLIFLNWVWMWITNSSKNELEPHDGDEMDWDETM